MRAVHQEQRKELDQRLPQITLETSLRFNIRRSGTVLIGPKFFATVANRVAIDTLGDKLGLTPAMIQRKLFSDPENLPMTGQLTAEAIPLDPSHRNRRDRFVVTKLNRENIRRCNWSLVHKILLRTTMLPISEHDQRVPSFVPPEIDKSFYDAGVTDGVQRSGKVGIVVGWMLNESPHEVEAAANVIGEKINAAIGPLQFSPAFIENP